MRSSRPHAISVAARYGRSSPRWLFRQPPSPAKPSPPCSGGWGGCRRVRECARRCAGPARARGVHGASWRRVAFAIVRDARPPALKRLHAHRGGARWPGHRCAREFASPCCPLEGAAVVGRSRVRPAGVSAQGNALANARPTRNRPDEPTCQCVRGHTHTPAGHRGFLAEEMPSDDTRLRRRDAPQRPLCRSVPPPPPAAQDAVPAQAETTSVLGSAVSASPPGCSCVTGSR